MIEHVIAFRFPLAYPGGEIRGQIAIQQPARQCAGFSANNPAHVASPQDANLNRAAPRNPDASLLIDRLEEIQTLGRQVHGNTADQANCGTRPQSECRTH